jgi:hypothetical protein
MRRISSILGLASALFLTVGQLAACGKDTNAKIKCSTKADCVAKTGALFDYDMGLNIEVQCCAEVCVLESQGCDSGYRYVTAAPAVGECAAAPMCPAQPDLTMMVEGDMSQPPAVDGATHD